MARIRTIKPDFYSSGKQLRLSIEAAFLLPCLWGNADDEGRLLDDPLEIGARCPRLFKKIDKLLNELEKNGWVLRYKISGKRYIQIHDWREHQKISHPAPSKIPAPLKSSENTPERSGNVPEYSKNIPGGKERKGKEGKGKEYDSKESARGAAHEPKKITAADPGLNECIVIAKEITEKRRKHFVRDKSESEWTFEFLSRFKDFKHFDVVKQFLVMVRDRPSYVTAPREMLYKLWNSKKMKQNYTESISIIAHEEVKKIQKIQAEKDRENRGTYGG